MIKTFERITINGTGDAATMSQGISEALVSTEIGLLIGFIGTGFLVVALLVNEYRALWFYRFMKVFSILSLLAIPIGTAGGIYCLIYLKKRKAEFLSPQTTNNPSPSP